MRFLVNSVVAVCGAGLLALASPGVLGLQADQDLGVGRQDYSRAVEAIDRGEWTQYRQLRPGLDDYPLAIYLDYYQLTQQPQPVRASEARRFIDLSADTPLPNRFLASYLSRAGRERRWRDFLTVKPDEPNSVELKCYYFRAKLASGDALAAWEGAERLWVHGKSRPKECDPLFDAWLKAGQLSDDLVWARLLEAFAQRQGSLMKYVARKGSSALEPWAEKALAVYRKPAQMRAVSLPPGDSRSAELATRGLVYLARYHPDMALEYWRDYAGELAFTPQQQREVEYAIALRTLFAKTEANLGWLPGALARLEDDKLVEIRLRWALGETDWDAVAANLALLSPAAQQQTGWRYWQARVLQAQGQAQAAAPLLQALATERDFYGFLAADALGKPYAFNHQSMLLQGAATQPLQALPGVQRVGELYYHDEQRNAHSEWHKILDETPDSSGQEALAQLAAEQGWHALAINAAAQAKAWDALDWRFPTPHQDVFRQYASQQQVPSTELMAIARRESAFFPQARSPVGARGLMQLMPATGKQVARRLGEPHSRAELYEVEHNVLLGSAYYRELLDRFGGNRIFALAAYNAGPHRVDRWRQASGATLPVDVWVETIPFRETRNYVKNVLSYNVVFQYLLGDTHALLTDAEKNAVY